MPTKGQHEQGQTLKGEALRLRCLGWTYREIGPEIGKSYRTAHKYVTEELERLAEECAEEAKKLRAIEHRRLEKLYAKAWERLDGDGIDTDDMARLLDQARKISESIRKLWGLDNLPQDGEEDPREQPLTIQLHVDGESHGIYASGANGHG